MGQGGVVLFRSDAEAFSVEGASSPRGAYDINGETFIFLKGKELCS